MTGFKIEIDEAETFHNEDRSWLGARKGADTCRSITLDSDLFAAAHQSAKGAVPSGTALGEVTATPGVYGPYDPAAVDGRATLKGLLFNTTTLGAPGSGTMVGAPLFWEGIVKQSKLPAFDGTVAGEVDADGRADLPSIRWEA